MTATTTTFTNAYVGINSVDVSHLCDSVTLTYNATMLDLTTFGADTHLFIAGLKDWTLAIGVKADFSVGGLDSQLFALVAAAAFPIAVRPVNSARSTTNPAYNATAVLKDYAPITGKVGDLLPQTVNFVAGGASPTLLRSVA